MHIVMAGTGVFAEPTFETLLAHTGQVVGLFTQPDRAVGQERGSTRQTGKGMKVIAALHPQPAPAAAQEAATPRQTGKGMKVIAALHHVPIFQPDSINTPESADLLRSLEADLLVVAAYGQILKDFILAIPRQGCINV